MKHKRREFIQKTGALTAASMILPWWACKEGATSAPATNVVTSNPSIKDFGIQLYTLRDDIPKDPKGILKQVASFGYTQIEGYEGDQGMFWNMPHLEFKQYLDSLGLNMVASHCNINENMEMKAAQAAEIGMDYLICPYIGAKESMDEWKLIADQFNACGEICKKNGIRFAYHNHAYSFKEVEGQIPQVFLMDNTDPGLVDFEFDLYWVITGGADPNSYFSKYPNRITLCHVKDRIKGVAADETDASCDLGTGSIDYPSILANAAKHGMKYYIVEQERYDNSTPLKSAEACANYMKTLEFTS